MSGNLVISAVQRRSTPVVLAIAFALVSCTHSAPPVPLATSRVAAPETTSVTLLDDEKSNTAGAQPKLSSDPAQLADDLVADEHALRDPIDAGGGLQGAAHRQQAAYRAIGVPQRVGRDHPSPHPALVTAESTTSTSTPVGS